MSTLERRGSRLTQPSHCPLCVRMSVHFAASLAILILAALGFFISLITANWSASGQRLVMGVWTYCVHRDLVGPWLCNPINEEFSVAVQAFSILAAMGYGCAFVLYIMFLIFHILTKSRPLVIGMCLIVFCIVCLQIMTLIVYGVKNRQLLHKVEKEYFDTPLEPLRISWSFACCAVSTLLATASGILLFVEFRNLTYDAIFNEPTDQSTNKPS